MISIIEDILLELHSLGQVDIVTMGDPNIDANYLMNSKCKGCLTTVKIFRLTQHIHTRTRVTNTSGARIDHISTNWPDLYNTFSCLDFGISDHNLVFMTRKKLKVQSETTYVWARSYRKYDPVSFYNEATNIDWRQALDILYGPIHLLIIDAHATYKNIKCKGDRLP